MKDRIEILASGFGGQGVVRLGQIVGVAAVNQGLRVTMLKSHGTEQRGGYVRTQLVLSSDEIDSPLVESPDYFVAMSSAAYRQFGPMVTEGMILYDPDMVEIDDDKPVKQVAVPARKTAVKELGREIYSNTVMLGALTGATAGLMEKENMLATMLKIIPKFKEENKKAFELGYAMTSGSD